MVTLDANLGELTFRQMKHTYDRVPSDRYLFSDNYPLSVHGLQLSKIQFSNVREVLTYQNRESSNRLSKPDAPTRFLVGIMHMPQEKARAIDDLHKVVYLENLTKADLYRLSVQVEMDIS